MPRYRPFRRIPAFFFFAGHGVVNVGFPDVHRRRRSLQGRQGRGERLRDDLVLAQEPAGRDAGLPLLPPAEGAGEGGPHSLFLAYELGSKDDFTAWTKSEQFRESHRDAGQPRPKPMYLGHPEFEGFETVLSETNPHLPAPGG